MSQMLGLGRLFNLGVSITTAKSRFSMRDYDQVGILMVGATAVSNLTLNECNAASGGTEQALAQVTQYWTQAVAGGTTAQTQGTAGGGGAVPAGHRRPQGSPVVGR